MRQLVQFQIHLRAYARIVVTPGELNKATSFEAIAVTYLHVAQIFGDLAGRVVEAEGRAVGCGVVDRPAFGNWLKTFRLCANRGQGHFPHRHAFSSARRIACGIKRRKHVGRVDLQILAPREGEHLRQGFWCQAREPAIRTGVS